jgi:hypothetical protein
MRMPGFSAESSLGKTNENYQALGTAAKGANRSQVVPQGCFTIGNRHCCCYFGVCECGHIIRAEA